MRALMSAARHARMTTEQQQQATTAILAAWHKWYDEAMASVDRLAR
jgi:hypothetical protein